MPIVTWRPNAAKQYVRALDYITERDETAAIRLEGLVNKSIGVLLVAPDGGRPGRVMGTREWVVHPNYLIIYKVTRSGVTILRFLHSRQQYP